MPLVPQLLGEKKTFLIDYLLYIYMYLLIISHYKNNFFSLIFRFGHSLVKSSLSRCNKDFREVPFFIKLHKELNNPANLHNFGSVDRLILGLASKKLGRRDEFITEELTNHLFQVNAISVKSF